MSAHDVTANPEIRRRARRLRRFLLVGLIVIAPLGVTVAVLAWAFGTIDDILGVPLRQALGFQVPGLGLALLFVAVLVVGWTVHQAAGRELLHWWNDALLEFPLAGRIYNTVSQIVQSVLGRQRNVFAQTVMIPFPTQGVWVIGFVTNDDATELSEVIGEPCINVFVPTTPNPTSGMMLVVPRSRARIISLAVEEAMKTIVSAGTVKPSEIPSAYARPGLDLESLFKDTGEWKATHG